MAPLLQPVEWFTLLVEECDNVKSLDELMERSATRLNQKAIIKHRYTCRNGMK